MIKLINTNRMMKYSYTIVLGIALLFSSCGNETNNNAPVSDTEHEHSSEESIELDNGEKWVVVEEMMGHIQNMETDVKSFENLEEKDFSVLATKLEDNIDLLTSNCTMTGKAHDELHKWLLPYIDLVGELSNAKDTDEASKVYKEIQTSFKTFNTYFK